MSAGGPITACLMCAYCGVCGKFFRQSGLKYTIFFVKICKIFGIFTIWESIMVLDDKMVEMDKFLSGVVGKGQTEEAASDEC